MNINGIEIDTEILISLIGSAVAGLGAIYSIKGKINELTGRIEDLETENDNLKHYINTTIKEHSLKVEKELNKNISDIKTELEKVEKNFTKINEKIEHDLTVKINDDKLEMENRTKLLFSKYDTLRDLISENDKIVTGIKTQILTLDKSIEYIQSHSEVFHEYKVLKAEVARLTRDFNTLDDKLDRVREMMFGHLMEVKK